MPEVILKRFGTPDGTVVEMRAAIYFTFQQATIAGSSVTKHAFPSISSALKNTRVEVRGEDELTVPAAPPNEAAAHQR
jgi:hypothetical protein